MLVIDARSIDFEVIACVIRDGERQREAESGSGRGVVVRVCRKAGVESLK